MTDQAVAVLIGGFIVSSLTEILSVASTYLKKDMPPWLKPILAAAAATWNPASLVIFHGASPEILIANAVVQWGAGKIVHDVLMSQTGGLSGGLKSGPSKQA